jgi:hypothetical protein
MRRKAKASRTFDITVDGEKKTIAMTYGLFNEIMKVIPHPEKITDLIVSDPYLRDYVVRRMLTGNKRVEKDEDLVDPFELDIDMDVLDDLVVWVGEHVLHFFMKSASKTAAIGEKYQGTVEQLTRLSQSLPGAEN